MIADFAHIQKFYEIESTSNIKYAPKIKDQHITPTNAQRMKVKYASQLLSHSVSAGK